MHCDRKCSSQNTAISETANYNLLATALSHHSAHFFYYQLLLSRPGAMNLLIGFASLTDLLQFVRLLLTASLALRRTRNLLESIKGIHCCDEHAALSILVISCYEAS